MNVFKLKYQSRILLTEASIWYEGKFNNPTHSNGTRMESFRS